MRLRSLGSTGLRVSLVGLGLAALGRPAYIDLGRDADLGPDRGVEALERRCHQVLDAAWESGVRYLDAARSTAGPRRSWPAGSRPGLDPDEVTVGSKWGYTYVGDWRMDADVHEVKDSPLAALTRQLGEPRPARRPPRPVPGPLGHPGLRCARGPGGAGGPGPAPRRRGGGRAVLQRARPGRHHPPRPGAQRRRDGPARLRAGDLEPAGAVRRPRPGRGERGRLGGDRQGGGRQRAADPARGGPRRPSSGGSRPATGSGWTRSRWPPCSPTPGPTWSCRARSPLPSWRPTWPPSGSSSTRGAGGAGRPGRAAERYWKERSALSWA